MGGRRGKEHEYAGIWCGSIYLQVKWALPDAREIIRGGPPLRTPGCSAPFSFACSVGQSFRLRLLQRLRAQLRKRRVVPEALPPAVRDLLTGGTV